ncbi:hypothetical protein DV738_g2348, partial [Chaetothyriales sp. CBS 135597]
MGVLLELEGRGLLHDPNMIYDGDDCRGNMAAKTLLRAVSHHYINKARRNGPFLLQFTDLHASNIFVDEAWNITCLLDLEWVCALPSEMLAVPYWLTGQDEPARAEKISPVVSHIGRKAEQYISLQLCYLQRLDFCDHTVYEI